MRESRSRAFLVDIREAARRVVIYTEGMEYDDFLQDLKTQDAVIRNLEIIGEAVKNIPDEMRAEAPNIPWKSIAAMRDKLIHHYFGVNLDIVWSVIRKDLPTLVEAVEALVSSLSEAEDSAPEPETATQ